MDNDLRPGQQPARSLQAKLDTIAEPKPSEQNFLTPEEVAAADDITQSPTTPELAPAKADTGKTPFWHWPPSRRGWIIIGVALVVILAASGILLFRHPAKPLANVKVTQAKTAPAKPATVPSTLSGLPVAPSVNNGPVTAVMVENSTDARPQSGLGSAGVVFEAVAEGGVTRFMALYQDTAPTNVGPIRSARPYYIQWALGFDAAYAHVGGSPDALSDITSWSVRDLNEFYNGSYYHRVSTRAAPHNVYTGIPTLNQLETKKGYTSSTYSGFPRKAAAPAKQPTAGSIKLSLSGSVYNPSYSYNPATNNYARSEGGAPETDANTNQQLAPTVVIAMVVSESRGALDASGAYYSNYNVVGSGPVYVFQDGGVTIGQWTKSSNTSQLSFTDSSGATIKLDPGQTWLTAVTSSSGVVYSP